MSNKVKLMPLSSPDSPELPNVSVFEFEPIIIPKLTSLEPLPIFKLKRSHNCIGEFCGVCHPENYDKIMFKKKIAVLDLSNQLQIRNFFDKNP